MKRLFAVMLLVALLLSAGSAVFAAPQKTPETAAQTAAQYLLENVPSPGVDHAAVVIALARGGYEVPAGYFSTYYNALAARVQQAGGVLSHTRYQDYSEAILALTAIGRDPRSVCGYDLTVPLGNYLETAKGGLRGVAFALLALDCGAYEIPADPSADVAATRELYVNFILNRQLSDGGWSFSGDASTAQATALALQALSAYEKRAGVRGAVMLGIDCLAALQGYAGGYGSAQADAEALLALAALGLQKRQYENELNEKKHAILASLSAGDRSYDEFIDAYVVDKDGRRVDGEDVFALLNDLPGTFEAGKFPIFEARDGRVVIPVTGMGLWGPVWGYVALEKDMNTVAGIIMAHKGETPGLGAEIATPKYQANFVGKTIFDGDKFVSVTLRKGGAKDPAHEVDAISGGTKTSDGVTAMLYNSLENYLPLLEAKRNAAAPAPAEVSNEENVENNE